MADTQTRLRRDVLACQVLPQPLLHQDAERRGDQRERQAGEPEDVDALGGEARLEFGDGAEVERGDRRVEEAGVDGVGVCLGDELGEEGDDDDVGVRLEVLDGLDEERGEDRRVKTGLSGYRRAQSMFMKTRGETMKRTKTKMVSISSL